MKMKLLLSPLLALSMLAPSLLLAKAVASETPAEPKKETSAEPAKTRDGKKEEEAKKAADGADQGKDQTAQIMAGLKLLQIVGGTAGKIALTLAGFSKLAKGLDITLNAATTITRELNKPEDKRNIALLTAKQKALQGVPAIIQPDLEKAGKLLATILEPLFKKSIINDLKAKGEVYPDAKGVEMVEITRFVRDETTGDVEEASVVVELKDAPKEKLKNLAYQVLSVGQGLQKTVADIIDSYIEAQKPTEPEKEAKPADETKKKEAAAQA